MKTPHFSDTDQQSDEEEDGDEEKDEDYDVYTNQEGEEGLENGIGLGGAQRGADKLWIHRPPRPLKQLIHLKIKVGDVF